MRTHHAVLALAGLALAGLAYALALFPALPDQIPTHWNLAGEVDGWMPKEWAIVVMPGAVSLFIALLYLLPALSPRHFRVEAFQGTFNYVMFLTGCIMAYFHLIMLQAALHPELHSGRVLIGGLFLFLALMGNVLGKVRRNFWVGVRTPWTLASERVWIATHRLAARLLVGAGLLGALAIWAGVPPAWCFAMLMAALLAPVFHSLWLYRRLEGE
jgi:uncharacterized membrane protein